MSSIKCNLDEVNERIKKAAILSGKDPKGICLISVTKTRSVSEINEAIDSGSLDIGENKVQEIMDKFDGVKPVRWHMIGHLQTNKVKYIIDKVSLIHSVDSFKLAEEINKRAQMIHKVCEILIEVNPAQEESKFGMNRKNAEELISEIIQKCPNIKVKGLMTIAPFTENPLDVKPYFDEVKSLYDVYAEKKTDKIDFEYLSMGMSHDFEVAIACGSNMVRVGTAIFGERNYV